MEGGENVKHRACVPSRNVLHLAAAFEFTRYAFEKGKNYQLGYKDFLWGRELLRFIIVRAEAFEPMTLLAAQNHHFKLDPASLIRIRLVEPGSK